MIKKYPYLTKKHIYLTNDALDIYRTSNNSNLNIKSIINFSKFKDIHLQNFQQYIREQLQNSELDINNSKFLNSIKKMYDTVDFNNVDKLFNWFETNVNNGNESQYCNYLHLLNSNKLNNTIVEQNILDKQDQISNALNHISSVIVNKVNDYALNENIPSKLDLDEATDIRKILQKLFDLKTNIILVLL